MGESGTPASAGIHPRFVGSPPRIETFPRSGERVGHLCLQTPEVPQ